jgi:hypothetical protein
MRTLLGATNFRRLFPQAPTVTWFLEVYIPVIVLALREYFLFFSFLVVRLDVYFAYTRINVGSDGSFTTTVPNRNAIAIHIGAKI